MSFDSTGVYTRPANSFSNPVAGTTIDPVTADTTFDDWETAFNNCLTKSTLAYVSTQFDKTSSATLGDVTGLSASLTAGKVYSFEAILFTTSPSAGGVKAAISGTATATSVIFEGHTIEANSIAYRARTDALGTAVSAITGVTTAFIRIWGLIVVNAAGTLTVQFAQNVSNGTASSVLVGSHLRVYAHT